MNKQLAQLYRNFLTESFEGLPLKAPLFYNWEDSLRFDLQSKGENPVSPSMPEYFELVQARANKLFESVFSNQDDILIVLYQYKYPSKKKFRIGNFVFQQIADLKKNEIEFSVLRGLYDPSDIWNRAIVKTKVANLNYTELLKAISHTDFPTKKPNIPFETYILNITKKSIFHMYDDRGLDVVASNKNSLVPIYKKHEAWLLDYDIELMHNRMKDVIRPTTEVKNNQFEPKNNQK